jgi:hypothetical protein
MTENDFEEFKKVMVTYLQQIIEARNKLFRAEDDKIPTETIETSTIKEVKVNKN